MSFLNALSFRKNSTSIKLVKRGVMLAVATAALAGCVVEPYPPAYPGPVAAAPAPYECCYSYSEYPAYYGYAGPSVGLEFGGFGGYRGGYGGYHGGGWGGGHGGGFGGGHGR